VSGKGQGDDAGERERRIAFLSKCFTTAAVSSEELQSHVDSPKRLDTIPVHLYVARHAGREQCMAEDKI